MAEPWKPMADEPHAVTLLYRKPVDKDGCQIVFLALAHSPETEGACEWAWIPGEEPAYDLKAETEPHRVCQNYKPMRNQELASRVVSIVNPHWRGSVKSTTATQVEHMLDRELTRMWNDIEEFHHKFRLDYGGAPRPLPWDLAQFRIKFMQEELDEYAAAYEADDSLWAREQMLDALVDLVYVALGTAYLHGFNFAEAWRRVQVANMSKVRVENAADSKRGSSFDVIKPAGWTPPSHIDLVGTMDSEAQTSLGGNNNGPGNPVVGRQADNIHRFDDFRDTRLEEPEEAAADEPRPDHDLF